MRNRLLETKFHIPLWRTGGVTRPRLVEKLLAGVKERRKLTLVSAPAGYGKTTLVVDWLEQTSGTKRSSGGMPSQVDVAWLSLDDADNDPAHFLGYWLSALRRVDDSLGQSAQSLLGMPQIPPPAEILDELINDLAAQETQIILALDDYHVIHNQDVHDALEYFIDHQPAQLHLVITTREDPPLPLSRLRARGQMTEIRERDLRFTTDEARQFFNQSMQLDLTVEAINALEARTEGWAAGLQLAALAMQDLPDQKDFLSGFSGSHRYVIDYLLDEVLKRQPAEIRAFVEKTALLRQFNAELCQAVTGNPASAAILTGLERSNLFLIPLDDQRGWYRFHHLFADVLRTGLQPEVEREIRIRAATWFESQDIFDEAITYWLAVPDPDRASHLISRLAPELLKNGELQILLGWLNFLPESVINQNLDLASHKALCLLLTGQTLLARDYALQADLTFSGQTQNPGHGLLLATQAWFAVNAGDPRTADLARAALEQLDASALFYRALALIALGNTLAWQTDLPASNQVFHDTWMLGRQMKHAFIALVGLANLAYNLLEMGQLQEAESLCRAALSEYVDSRGRHLPVLGIIYIPLASICYEKCEFDEAHDLAARGIDLCRRLFSNIIMGGDGEITLARIAFERGNLNQAIEILQSAADAARQRGMSIIVYKMTIVKTELYLMQGKLNEAKMGLADMEAKAPPGVPKSEQLSARLRVRLLIAAGEIEKALDILAGLEQLDRERGSIRALMGVYLTRALAYQSRGDQAQATHAFEAALRLAAPQGYRVLFIPHSGRLTRTLLESTRAIAPDFVDSILQIHPAAEASPSPIAALPEPLSAQEIRVLKLIAAGRSNQEIADELVISAGTAKWHVHNILQKLEVNNRAQAIARARELGIT